MPTLGDIKGRIKQLLQGYTRNQEQISWLSAPMLATDTSFTADLGTVSGITRGLVEIDDELMLVNMFNATTGTVTIAAGLNGRGVESTTPSAHGVNAIVTNDPDFPAQRITEALNDTIQATYPDLYQMNTYDFAKVAARYEYPMPTNVEDIVRVTFDTIGPSRVKSPSQSWRFNPQCQIDTTGGLTTGKSLEIMDFIVPGRTIHTVYSQMPGRLVNDTDDYLTVVGFPERTIDMMMYGATARLLSGVEAARLQQKNVESTERAPLVPTGAASNAAQYFWKLYNDRLNQEMDRLHQLFPTYQSFLA